ncbi:heat shock cognate 70 kDa protein-like [Amaranthus tricolor]|uniref:heat shock cognate 70 kDa protein-like n=1 Tax=Amaranthus tricolor TaxID=29722 RepID=UPI002588C24C|nr:heat shock cognate 70 kDa protein-like [Amaranthus tricolor]
MGESMSDCEWPVIGIDLGTCYSCVAVWRDNRVEIITNDQGNRTTPSWVAFNDKERLIGEAALNQAGSNPCNTIFDAKRLIGRRFNDESVQEDMKSWPFKVVSGTKPGTKHKPMVSVLYKGEHYTFTPEEISSMVLMKMKDIAEAFYGSKIKNAVVTVPAYFSDSQRQATKDAGTIAGLNVVRIINEPTAAAMAYGLDTKLITSGSARAKTVLIFDFGGGTFDVSLVAIEKGEFIVKAITGDAHLGGGDFNNRMLSYFAKEFKRKNGFDISKNPRAIARLRTASERAKRVLSSAAQTDIEVDCLFEGTDFRSTITRARFEKLNMELFLKSLDIVKNCLRDANMEKWEVDDVVLVGGSTRIPMIQKLLTEFFDGKDLCTSINPDEAVAFGAAIHAANISGVGKSIKDIVLVDVTPFSLGTSVVSGDMSVVIPRNTPIPAKMFDNYTTVYDNQTSVAFCVYAGERPIAVDNNFLGKFTLLGIPPVPHGIPELKVSFEIDVDGILTVSATEKSTGNSNQITIKNHKGGLSKADMDRMLLEAEFFKAEDKKRRKVVNAKNALEIYANRLKHAMDRGKVTNIGNFRKMENAVDLTLEWLEECSDDVGDAFEFEKKLEDLQRSCGYIKL